MNLNKLTTIFLAFVLTSATVGCLDKKENSNSGDSEIQNVSPESIVFEWQSLYEQKLNEFSATEDFSEIAQNGYEESRFDLFDINGDGTPELFISANNNHKTQCQIFTVSNGQLINAGSIGEYGCFTYYPELELINDEYSGNGFVVGKFMSFNGISFDEYFSYNDNSGSASQGAEIKHEINGENLSLPEYDEIMEKYRNARTTSIGRKYTFGSSTIEYALYCSESWGAVLSPHEKELYCEQLKSDLTMATESGKDASFEFCDLNNDAKPELIVSEGTSDDDSCKIYYISNNTLCELDGNYGYNGKLYFDNEQFVIYAIDDANNACWSLTDNNISSFNISRSHMEVGRKYILTEKTIEMSVR